MTKAMIRLGIYIPPTYLFCMFIIIIVLPLIIIQMQPSSQKKKKNQMQPMSQLESKLTSHLHTSHYQTCNYL